MVSWFCQLSRPSFFPLLFETESRSSGSLKKWRGGLGEAVSHLSMAGGVRHRGPHMSIGEARGLRVAPHQRRFTCSAGFPSFSLSWHCHLANREPRRAHARGSAHPWLHDLFFLRLWLHDSGDRVSCSFPLHFSYFELMRSGTVLLDVQQE